MVRKILIPLDGSKQSESILAYGEELLSRTDANVTLASVLRHGTAKEERIARAKLQPVAERLREKGVCVETVLLEGDPASEIVGQAREGAYDLIAMSTRGKSGLRRLMLGSVTEEVLRLATTPVLVAHPAPEGASEPELRKIVVPLDGSHRSASILPFVSELARAHGTKLAFVTVVSPTKKEDLPVEVVSKNLFNDQKRLKEQGLEVEIAVLYGDPAMEVLKFAENNKADLIALSTHGRTGLDRLRYGSVAEAILRKSRLPMLVIRTAAIVREHPVHATAAAARRRSLRIAEEVGKGSKSPYSG
jgi:nucleotide-binding universal stress UspA family protein